MYEKQHHLYICYISYNSYIVYAPLNAIYFLSYTVIHIGSVSRSLNFFALNIIPSNSSGHLASNNNILYFNNHYSLRSSIFLKYVSNPRIYGNSNVHALSNFKSYVTSYLNVSHNYVNSVYLHARTTLSFI